MTKIIFENDTGRLCLSGGGDEAWRITRITGLGMSDKKYQTVSYFSEAGQKTVSERREARIITIAGDVLGTEKSAAHKISRAIKILDKPGWLVIRSNGVTRRIEAYCTGFEEGDAYGIFKKFAMQFCCDCPYFEDVGNDFVALFKRTKEIKNTFKFPKIFTGRISGGVVINRGDVEAEPIFNIYFGAEIAAEKKIILTICNETSDCKLVMTLYPKPCDVVTIDIAKRRIYNDRGENLITSLSDDSSLNKFILKEGANNINVTSDAETNLSIVCRFVNRYLEAVC
ncbi:MAG: phage tail family protein [Clostridia bacterium]|nr:phage tail family protein [Clostridia bacterium]